jgi:hypothetical protein
MRRKFLVAVAGVSMVAAASVGWAGGTGAGGPAPVPAPAAKAAPAPAPAAPAPDPGRVLFVRGGVLVSLPGDGKGQPSEILALPDDIGTAQALEATADGGLVVVRGDKGSAWLVAGEKTWRTGCAGRARPSPSAECVLCDVGGKLSLIGTVKTFTMDAGGPWHDASFLGGPRELAALTADGVLAFVARDPKTTRKLTQAGAESYLLVAPDGSKGVAVFGKGLTSRVFGFELDGKGVPRQLGGPGFPVVWSWDSTWVLIQEGAPPGDEGGAPGDGGDEGGEPGDSGGGEGEDGGGGEGMYEGGAGGAAWLFAAAGDKAADKAGGGKGKTGGKKATPKKDKNPPKKDPPRARVRTCVVRAVGGETKCWNSFEPRSFAPDGDHVLMWREGVLYVGIIHGVNPETPHKLTDKADGPAVWVK